MKILFLALAALLVAGCATTVVHDRPESVRMGGVALDAAPLVEALRTRKGVLVQAVDGAWRDRTFQAQCVMKGDGEKLTVVFLAPQVRLVTITVEKPCRVSCERVPQIPQSFEPEYALADLAFVNLETDALRRALAPTHRVEESGTTRRILTAAGTAVAEVERRGDGTVVLRNLEHGYSYTLKTIGG